MGKLLAQLVQNTTYKSPCGVYKSVTRVVAVLKGPRVRRKNEVSWDEQPFHIPVDMSPSITESSIITVDYKLLLLLGIIIIVYFFLKSSPPFYWMKKVFAPFLLPARKYINRLSVSLAVPKNFEGAQKLSVGIFQT